MLKRHLILAALAVACTGCTLEDVKCSGKSIVCDDKCIDPASNNDYCGAKGMCQEPGDRGEKCEENERCSNKQCKQVFEGICKEGYIHCGDYCIDPNSDREFCGAEGNCEERRAGTTCQDGEDCVGGRCLSLHDALHCPDDQIVCAKDCTDPMTDRNYCGASGDCTGENSGTKCGQDDVCRDGVCVSSKDACSDGEINCSGACVDPQSDANFCGASGDCDGSQAGTRCSDGETCENGSCVSGSTGPGSIVITKPERLVLDKNKTLEFRMKLSGKPAAEVTVPLSLSNEKLAVLSVDKLVFSPENWDIEQTFSVTRDSNDLPRDLKFYLEVEKTASEDADFDRLEIDPVEITALGLNEVGIAASVERVEMEEGDIFSLGIELGKRPSGKVRLLASLTDNSNGIDETNVVELARTDAEFLPEDIKDGVMNWAYFEIEALRDNKIDGDHELTLSIVVNATDDSHYQGIQKVVPITVRDIDKAEIVVDNCEQMFEEGESSVCSVRLASIPESSVTVGLKSFNSDSVSVSPASLSFGPEDALMDQEVTFQSHYFETVDIQHEVEIEMKPSSSDANYAKAAKTLTLTIMDKDRYAIEIEPGYETILDENMCNDVKKLNVKLGGKPAKSVTIKAVSAETGELLVDPPSQVIEPEQWKTGVTFNYQCVDDADKDGDRQTRISFESESEDAGFNGLKSFADVTVVDNDVPGMYGATKTVSCNGSNSDQFEFETWLTAKPSGNVTLNLSLVDGQEAPLKGVSLDKTSVEFTPDDWNVHQKVVVTGPNLSDQGKAERRPGKNCYSKDESRFVLEVVNDVGEYKAGMKKAIGFLYKPFCVQKSSKHGKYELMLQSGDYLFQVKGAGGGGTNSNTSNQRYYDIHGGKGGYSEGTIHIDEDTKIFAYVGGTGSSCSTNTNCGGFNGGGRGGSESSSYYGMGGGGASDIRIGTDDLKYRVIVAGGGGGVPYLTYSYIQNKGIVYGGDGGGRVGDDGDANTGYVVMGGADVGCRLVDGKDYTQGHCQFGVALNAEAKTLSGGGGGGWWSGTTGYNATTSKAASGAGGSGYVFNGKNVSKGKLDAKYKLSNAKTEKGKGSASSTDGNIVITAVCN